MARVSRALANLSNHLTSVAYPPALLAPRAGTRGPLSY